MKQERIPDEIKAEVEAILALTDGLCKEHLDAGYAELCRKVVGKLARKRPSPLSRGDLRIWAAAVIYAVGSVNFLFDPAQKPHMTGDDLSALTGVPKSTLAAKAKKIRDLLRLAPFSLEFSRPEILASSDIPWMIQVGGYIVDARQMPPEIQEEARKRGLIPDFPASVRQPAKHREEAGSSASAPASTRRKDAAESKDLPALIRDLQGFDAKQGLPGMEEACLDPVRRRLVEIGAPAVESLIEVLTRGHYPSAALAARVLGAIRDARAVPALVRALEIGDAIGEAAEKALIEIGPACLPETMQAAETMIDGPAGGKHAQDRVSSALSVIGGIRCDESAQYLNSLLERYLAEMPSEPFDADEKRWKFGNVEFFHLLDCLVRQQDDRAIPVIEKARDRFPPNYVDHIVCRIAIGRIRKKRVEGYLPMEALEIQLPSDRMMSALLKEKPSERDTLQERYGEYLRD